MFKLIKYNKAVDITARVLFPVPVPRDAPGVRDAGRGVQQPPAVSGAGEEETEGRGAQP